MTSICSSVCYVVLHTLAPYGLLDLHTKRHVTGINLVYSFYLSSYDNDGAMTAGYQLMVVDKAMQ